MCACITVPVQRYLKIHIPARPFLMNLLYDFILTPALLQPLQSSTTLQVSSSLMRVLLRNCLFCRTCNTLPDKQFPKTLISPVPPPHAKITKGNISREREKSPIAYSAQNMSCPMEEAAGSVWDLRVVRSRTGLT